MENYYIQGGTQRFQTIAQYQDMYQKLILDISQIDQNKVIQQEEEELAQRVIPTYEDLKVLIDDSSEVLPPLYVFIAGLLVGRSHAQISLSESLQIMTALSKVQDKSLKKELEQEILFSSYQDKHLIIDKLAMAKVKENMVNEEQYNLIEKELSSVDPKINEILGGDSDCQHKLDFEQSELARNHFETLYNQSIDRHQEIVQQNHQVQMKPAVQNFEEEKKQEFSDKELALKLQQEFNEEEQKSILQKQQQQNDNEKCCVCMQPYYSEQYKDQPGLDLISLKGCDHLFHKECIGFYLFNLKKQSDVAIFDCPFPNCQKTLVKQDVETYLNQYDSNRQSMAYVTYGCCPTPDCPYIFQTPNVAENKAWNPRFDCPICDASYCMKCKKNFHFGNKCNEKDVQGIVRPGQNQIQKQCPKCKYWVNRKNFEQKLHCRCGNKFCFFCGGKKCKCHKGMNFNRQYDGNDFGNLESMKKNYRNSLAGRK